jgi:hypothetical protein
MHGPILTSARQASSVQSSVTLGYTLDEWL